MSLRPFAHASGEPRQDPGPQRLLASERADRQWRRVLAVGLLLAVVLHVLVLLSWRVQHLPTSPFAAAGPQERDAAAAAGGGGGMRVIEFRVREEVPDVVAVVPVPEVEIVEPEPEPVEVEQPRLPEIAVNLPGAGREGTEGEAGSSVGPGIETGTGQGAGGTEAAGDASRLVPPRPRGMILPPTDRPRDLRGLDVTVWVWVNAQGRVVADSTRLEPPTRDSGYNRRLMRSAAEWVFEPGRRDGRAIGTWYPFQITL